MVRFPTIGPLFKDSRRVDAEGELYVSPSVLRYVWPLLGLAILLEAANELFGFGGPVAIYQTWIHDLVIATAAVLVLARAAYEPSTRLVWLAFGLAGVLWSAGSRSVMTERACGHLGRPTTGPSLASVP